MNKNKTVSFKSVIFKRLHWINKRILNWREKIKLNQTFSNDYIKLIKSKRRLNWIKNCNYWILLYMGRHTMHVCLWNIHLVQTCHTVTIANIYFKKIKVNPIQNGVQKDSPTLPPKTFWLFVFTLLPHCGFPGQILIKLRLW